MKHIKILEFPDSTKIWSLNINQRPVGFVGLQGNEIVSLLVDKPYRGNGFGEALVRNVIDYAKAKESISELVAVSRNDREGAQNVFRQLGFKEEKGENIYGQGISVFRLGVK